MYIKFLDSTEGVQIKETATLGNTLIDFGNDGAVIGIEVLDCDEPTVNVRGKETSTEDE